jgi:hypothetical protein
MRAKQPRQPPRPAARTRLRHRAGDEHAVPALVEGESWDPWPVILKATFCLKIASLIAVYAAMFLQAGAHGAA